MVDREERPDVDAVLHGRWSSRLTGPAAAGRSPSFLTPDGEPFFGGTYFPPEPRHGLPAGAARGRGRAHTASGRTTSPLRPSSWWRPCGSRPRARAAELRRCSPRPRAACSAGRPTLGRLRPRAEVPPRPCWSSCWAWCTGCPCGSRSTGWPPAVCGGPHHRRLTLGRCAVARAALREDALRQRTPRPAVPPRVAAHRRGAVPRRRRANAATISCASCASRAAASPPRAGRGHRRGRGAHVHLDCRRGSAGRAARAVRARPLDPARGARRRRGRGCSRSAIAGRSRVSTTRSSRPGTGSLAALAEGARRLERADLSAAASELGALLSADPLWRTAPGRSREISALPRGLRERRARAPASCTSQRRPASHSGGSALAAVEPRRFGAGRLLPCAGRRRAARRARQGVQRQPDARGRFDCSRSCSCGSARIWGDDELERTAVGALRLVRDLLPGAERVRLGAVRARRPPSAARARDRRRRGLGRRPGSAAWAMRPGRRHPVARGQDARRGEPAVCVCERLSARRSPIPPSSSETTRGSRSSPSKIMLGSGSVPTVEHLAERLPVANCAGPLDEVRLLHREGALLGRLDHHSRIDERIVLLVHVAECVRQACAGRVLARVLEGVPGSGEAVDEVPDRRARRTCG